MQLATELSQVQVSSVPAAIEWLMQARGRSFDEEIDYLKRLSSSAEVLKLYREMFPGQYSMSKASMFDADREWPEYTEREIEFLMLLDRQDLLPLHLAIEWEWLQERQPGIPVPPISGFQWCCWDFSADELPDGYLLGYGIVTNEWTPAQERYGLRDEDLPCSNDLDCKAVDEMFSREPDVLKFLPVMTDMMHLSTGNIFLDTTYCCNPTGCYAWTLKDMRLLIRDYKRARMVLNGIGRLDDLVEANPTAAYHRVRDIINQTRSKKSDADRSVKD